MTTDADDEQARDRSRPSFTMEVCIDATEPALVATFWSDLLGYRIDGDIEARGVHLEPPHPGTPVLNVQRVPEAKATKNRLHLDLYVDDPQPWIESSEALGAQRVRENNDPKDWYQVMRDPAGNEYCICKENT